MKKLLGIGMAATMVFAAGISSAKPLNWSGTLKNFIGDLPQVDVPGGGVATVNGSSGTLPAHLNTIRLAASRGIATGTQTRLVTDPDTILNNIRAVVVQFQPKTGTLGPISGAVTGGGGRTEPPQLTQNTLPIGGIAKICLLSTVCSDFLPLFLTQPTTNGARFQVNTATANQLTPGMGQGKRLGIPGTGIKGVGIGGVLTVGGDAAIRISLGAAPWTVKTATAIDQTSDNVGAAGYHNITRMGFAHGPASGTTSTAQVSGVLQIVTPGQVRTNLAQGSSKKIATITTLVVHFVPEPGMLLLIGSGVVGLALLGRNRMRK